MFQTKQTASGIEISYPGKEKIHLNGWSVDDTNYAIADAIADTSTLDEAYECLLWLAWASQG